MRCVILIHSFRYNQWTQICFQCLIFVLWDLLSFLHTMVSETEFHIDTVLTSSCFSWCMILTCHYEPMLKPWPCCPIFQFISTYCFTFWGAVSESVLDILDTFWGEEVGGMCWPCNVKDFFCVYRWMNKWCPAWFMCWLQELRASIWILLLM